MLVLLTNDHMKASSSNNDFLATTTTINHHDCHYFRYYYCLLLQVFGLLLLCILLYLLLLQLQVTSCSGATVIWKTTSKYSPSNRMNLQTLDSRCDKGSEYLVVRGVLPSFQSCDSNSLLEGTTNSFMSPALPSAAAVNS